MPASSHLPWIAFLEILTRNSKILRLSFEWLSHPSETKRADPRETISSQPKILYLCEPLAGRMGSLKRVHHGQKLSKKHGLHDSNFLSDIMIFPSKRGTCEYSWSMKDTSSWRHHDPVSFPVKKYRNFKPNRTLEAATIPFSVTPPYFDKWKAPSKVDSISPRFQYILAYGLWLRGKDSTQSLRREVPYGKKIFHASLVTKISCLNRFKQESFRIKPWAFSWCVAKMAHAHTSWIIQNSIRKFLGILCKIAWSRSPENERLKRTDALERLRNQGTFLESLSFNSQAFSPHLS